MFLIHAVGSGVTRSSQKQTTPKKREARNLFIVTLSILVARLGAGGGVLTGKMCQQDQIIGSNCLGTSSVCMLTFLLFSDSALDESTTDFDTDDECGAPSIPYVSSATRV